MEVAWPRNVELGVQRMGLRDSGAGVELNPISKFFERTILIDLETGSGVLHRSFMDLEADEDIAAFASHYGYLDGYARLDRRELVETWRDAIVTMRAAVELASTADAFLVSRARAAGTSAWRIPSGIQLDLSPTTISTLERIDAPIPLDVPTALQLAHRVAARNLQDPKISPAEPDPMVFRFELGIRTPDGPIEPHVIPMCSTLRQVLWAEFLRGLDEGFSYRRCANDACANGFMGVRAWLALGPGHYSRNREFCSDACKMRVTRLRTKRRQEANRLAQQGIRARAIAERLSVDPRTVRSWLSETKGGV